MGDDRLAQWASKQLDWARDALRRHAQSSYFTLSDEDKSSIVARVRQTAGFELPETLDHDVLTEDHLSFGSDTGPRIILASLGPVENVARLAKDQQLRFALNSLTLIYGDNASGKSGYCRITKKICRSQTVEDLLGDVFVAGAKPPAEVLIRYLREGDKEVTEEKWKDGTAPPKGLRSIAVFDSRNARFYIDKQNRVEFLPAEISLLERHGGHCKEMGQAFEAERRELEKQLSVPLPGGFTPDGEIAKTLGQLVLKSKSLPSTKTLQSLGAWTDADKAELEELGKALAQDPVALASRDERCQAALQIYVKALPAIEAGLHIDVAVSLKAKMEEAKASAEAAAVAAQDAFASEPLPKVGNDAWHQMYDHAKAFVASAGIAAELPSEQGDLCALCQQPLSAEASDRLQRFKEYVSGATAKKAEETAAALTSERAKLDALAISAKSTVTQALAEYKAIDGARSELTDRVVAFFEAAIARRDALKTAKTTDELDEVPELPESVLEDIRTDCEALKTTAEEYRDQAKLDTNRAVSVRRQNDLKDREKLHNSLTTVLARRDDLDRHGKICECEKLVGTQGLSTFITSYRRELFTQALEDRVQAEIDNLDLSHIPFAVTDQSKDGNSLFRVGLKAPSPVENDKILSEGEQRALALACFLAEAGGDEEMNGLVIDDPVSSLDHLRIRKVANRLAQEAAKGRQVIVFTHNLLFYNEVLSAAATADPQVQVARRVISKSGAKGFGIISEEAEPWSARKITTRVGDLRKRRSELETQFSDYNTEEYRRAAKDFYTDLRETWERLVEEMLLGEVVERYASEVKTQSLKRVQVDDDDYRTVFFAMKRVSERSGHDMPAGKQIPTPTPDDMKADLNVIDTYRDKIKKRGDESQTRRKALEMPPAAEVV